MTDIVVHDDIKFNAPKDWAVKASDRKGYQKFSQTVKPNVALIVILSLATFGGYYFILLCCARSQLKGREVTHYVKTGAQDGRINDLAASKGVTQPNTSDLEGLKLARAKIENFYQQILTNLKREHQAMAVMMAARQNQEDFLKQQELGYQQLKEMHGYALNAIDSAKPADLAKVLESCINNFKELNEKLRPRLMVAEHLKALSYERRKEIFKENFFQSEYVMAISKFEDKHTEKFKEMMVDLDALIAKALDENTPAHQGQYFSLHRTSSNECSLSVRAEWDQVDGWICTRLSRYIDQGFTFPIRAQGFLALVKAHLLEKHGNSIASVSKEDDDNIGSAKAFNDLNEGRDREVHKVLTMKLTLQ